MGKITIYGDPISGNCLKVKWTADYLNIDYDWVDVDILNKETRTDEFLDRNPFGQVPCVVFSDGRTLAQSNAIVLHLAEQTGDALLPSDPSLRAKVYEWMFWEQNSHEPYVAGRRFRKSYLKLADDEIDAEWLPRGYAALERMDHAVSDSHFLVGNTLTAADIVLAPYTRASHEGGFSLDNFPNVSAWIARVERGLGVAPYGAS